MIYSLLKRDGRNPCGCFQASDAAVHRGVAG
jgi:hypothetical protein